jgi:hypothetical protein
MSDKRKPALADVLDAVIGVGRKQGEFGLKLEAFGLQLEALGVKQDEFGLKLEALGVKQEEFGLKLEALGVKQEEFGLTQEELSRRQEELGGRQDEFGLKQDGLRVGLMDRMDRLQDALTEQHDDISVMLELLATNQRIAERGLSEARTSFDLHSRTAAALTTMQRQLRHLQDEVNQLRGSK